MNYGRRVVAFVLSVLLVTSNVLTIPATAFALSEGDSVQSTSSETSDTEGTNVSTENDATSEQNEENQSPAQKNVPSDTPATDPINSNDDATDVSFEFLYVAYPELEVGTEQEMAFSSCNPEDVIEKAIVTISNEMGEKSEIEASLYSEQLAGFVFGDGLSEGTYSVDSIRYWVAGSDVEYLVDLESKGYEFTVITATYSDDSIDTEVYYADATGEAVEADSIEDALEGAQSVADSGISTMSLNGRSSLDSTKGSPVIALDPGHGGYDSGAVGNGKVESDLTWKIAVACRERLEEYGFTVVMAREQNGSYDGNDFLHRVDRVLAQGAQVYVSLHINSASAAAHGAEVYAPTDNGSSNTVISNELAQKVMDNLAALGLSYRGVKQMVVGDEFAVIRCAREAGIPGILIEHAFISNASDVANYLSDEGCKRLGVADAEAIIAQFPKSTWLDYSAVFDADYYLEHNRDVKAAYGDDKDAAFDHFMKYGMDEGRPSSPDFDVASYYNANRDLRAAYGTDLRSYYVHYIRYGKSEGRQCVNVPELTSYVTTRDGVDYSPVYNGAFYRSHQPDVSVSFEKKTDSGIIFDDVASLNHFIKYGMKEGRVASENFDPVSYYNAYADLRSAYGTDISRYYTHYITSGRFEGRSKTKGIGDISSYITSMGGVDYSPVYDGAFYRERYSDLEGAFSTKCGSSALFDDTALLRHFINSGMAEGRRGSEDFDVVSYYNANLDVRIAYGMDLAKYYMHYVNFGKDEGRVCKNADELTTYRSSMGGVDYSPVYDGAFYRERYSDLEGAFSTKCGSSALFDDTALLRHFINSGMAEGRRGSEDFNVTAYRYRYPDLQKVYGSSLKNYYLHYLNYGYEEGRTGTDEGPCETIMGDTGVSAAAMSDYYIRTVGAETYPSSVFSSRGAASIQDFCQIVYEEAKDEGVRGDILFAQIMKETGWLRFGGSAKPEQCNFGGLGAVSSTVGGASFPNVRIGIRAQVQHLKAYACTDELNNECVDPRFNLVVRGSAPLVTDLNGKWAVPGDGYGESIISIANSLKAS